MMPEFFVFPLITVPVFVFFILFLDDVSVFE